VNALQRPVFAFFARVNIADDNIELLFPGKANGALAVHSSLDGIAIGLESTLIPCAPVGVIVTNQVIGRAQSGGARAQRTRHLDLLKLSRLPLRCPDGPGHDVRTWAYIEET